MAHRPSESPQEGKMYCPEKHKLYGYKSKISVQPIGIAINCNNNYPGAVRDLELFQKCGVFINMRQNGAEQKVGYTDAGKFSNE